MLWHSQFGRGFINRLSKLSREIFTIECFIFEKNNFKFVNLGNYRNTYRNLTRESSKFDKLSYDTLFVEIEATQPSKRILKVWVFQCF